jgi:hypothetical protein
MIDAVGIGESPYTYTQEIYEHAGKRFAMQVQLIPMKRADAEQWVAFLASLRGRRGTFLMGDPIGQTPRGIATGTPLVKGASQTGGTLLTDGWTISQTGIMKAGDWIQLGTGATSRLHKVLQDANSDGSGNATLELWPGPRTAPADNEVIVVTNTKSLWRLVDNSRSYDIGAAQVIGLGFDCVEAL